MRKPSFFYNMLHLWKLFFSWQKYYLPRNLVISWRRDIKKLHHATATFSAWKMRVVATRVQAWFGTDTLIRWLSATVRPRLPWRSCANTLRCDDALVHADALVGADALICADALVDAGTLIRADLRRFAVMRWWALMRWCALMHADALIPVKQVQPV